MSENNAPIRGKCTWWRESERDEDRWDVRVKPADRRVDCTCFVEGTWWTVTRAEVPPDCPQRLSCRYYIKNG